MKRALLLAAVLLALGASGARAVSPPPPCSKHICHLRLIAAPHVEQWSPERGVGERWALYLNVYVGGKQLGYERLPSKCVAAYTGAKVAVRLRACGSRPFTLQYVSFAGNQPLRVTFLYVLN